MRRLLYTILLSLLCGSKLYAAGADSALLHAHVLALTGIPGGYRNGADTATLNKRPELRKPDGLLWPHQALMSQVQ